jgi:hypothetical protein
LNWNWEQFSGEVHRQIGWSITLASFGRNKFEANQFQEDGHGMRTLAHFDIKENMLVTVVVVSPYGVFAD